MWWRREKGKEMARKYKALRILAPAGGILEDNINQVGGGYVDISQNYPDVVAHLPANGFYICTLAYKQKSKYSWGLDYKIYWIDMRLNSSQLIALLNWQYKTEHSRAIF